MRFATVLTVALACSCAFASDPGQPLDCSDWLIVEPSLSCSPVVGQGIGELPFYNRGSSRNVDTGGRLLVVRRRPLDEGQQLYRTELVALDSQGQRVLAYVDDRRLGSCTDQIRPSEGMAQSGSNSSDVGGAATFDPVHGRLIVGLERNGCGYVGWWLLAQFDGFARLFDVLQSFTPSNSLAVLVPAMPEGMGGADHFDTYWGPLSKPIDFTQAHPLQCDYPAAAPSVGDHLTVADTVPTPAPGQGVYYVTSATYQGATRYGRKTTAGQLSGRDPALLPVCAP